MKAMNKAPSIYRTITLKYDLANDRVVLEVYKKERHGRTSLFNRRK